MKATKDNTVQVLLHHRTNDEQIAYLDGALLILKHYAPDQTSMINTLKEWRAAAWARKIGK